MNPDYPTVGRADDRLDNREEARTPALTERDPDEESDSEHGAKGVHGDAVESAGREEALTAFHH